MASVLRQRKPHDKNTGNISEDDDSGKKTIYEPSMITRAEEKVKVEPTFQLAWTEGLNELQSWRSLITGKHAALVVGVFSKSPSRLTTPSRLSPSAGGFMACLLLVARPPKDLAVLLEDLDLPSFPLDFPSLGPDVDWKHLFAQNSPLVPWVRASLRVKGKPDFASEHRTREL
jgi:hypothetical protein